jgi:hypothetical protein
LPDNCKVKLGGSDDLQIYHDGSHSYVSETGTGNLVLGGTQVWLKNSALNENMLGAVENGAVTLYYDAVEKLSTTSAGATLKGDLILTGSGTSTTNSLDISYDATNGNATINVDSNGGNTNLGFGTSASGSLTENRLKITYQGNVQIPNDAGKLELGASQDLKIYHDGNNSFIKDSGTGGLYIYTNTLAVTNAAGSENMIYAAENGAVTLYYDNAVKLATTATGVAVTGGLTVSGDLTINGTTTTVNTTNLLVEDPLILLANVQTGTPTLDCGLILERGSESNVGIIWDESADLFSFINTNDDATTSGNVTIASYADIKAETAILGLTDGNGLLLGVTAFGGAGNQRLQIGATLAGSSSATAQINGLVRTSYIITHSTGYGIAPNSDGQSTLGASGQRWSTVYGQVGDFNSSLKAQYFNSHNITADGQADITLFGTSNGNSQTGAFFSKLKIKGGGTQSRDLQLWQEDSGYSHIGTSWSGAGNNQLHIDDFAGLYVNVPLAINGDITNSADGGYYYLNNAGTGNSGLYIAGFSTDIMRCHVPAGKYFEWEVGGSQKLKLDSAGLLTAAGGATFGGTVSIDVNNAGSDAQFLMHNSNNAHLNFLSGNSAGGHDGDNPGNTLIDFRNTRDFLIGASDNTGLTNRANHLIIAGDTGYVTLGNKLKVTTIDTDATLTDFLVVDSNGEVHKRTSGAKGAQGATGAQGAKGQKGQTGGTGAKGAQGATGPTGAKGQKGQQGAQGGTGPTGSQGAKGATGAQGGQGAQGGTGPTGAKGQKGQQGAQGGTGPTGAQGAKGATGAQGGQGAQGGTGPTGAKGQKGQTGGTGPTGSQGSKGQKGAAASIANDANNRVITADGDGSVTAESNLTFTGSALSVTGTAYYSSYVDFNSYIHLQGSGSRLYMYGVDNWIQHDGSGFDVFGNNTQLMYIADSGTVTVYGHLAATTKSFFIDHPTKEGRKLRYGSLEGPEHAVYTRGRSQDSFIELPDYWTKLIDPDSITVTLTPIGQHQKLYVNKIENNKVFISSGNLLDKKKDYFYVIYAERIDVDKLEVEPGK